MLIRNENEYSIFGDFYFPRNPENQKIVCKIHFKKIEFNIWPKLDFH